MKKELNFRCCDSEKYRIPILEETVDKQKGYLKWGSDNQFVNTLFSCFDDCSILGTAINAMSEYICGSGIEKDYVINRKGELLSEVLAKVVFDYVVCGNATVQVIKNKKDEIAEINYVDVRNCRITEDGEYVLYNTKWTAYARDYKKFALYTPSCTATNAIYWIKAPHTKQTYAKPMWNSALRDVLTIIEGSKRNYTNTINGFTPSTLINFVGLVSDDVADTIEQSIIEKYTGSNGTNILLTWSDSKESAPTVSKIDSEDFSERYKTIMEACKGNVLAAFRCSPQLLGIIDGSTAFNSTEFADAFSLWKTTVVAPHQRNIENQFQKIGFDVKFKEFKVEFSVAEDTNIM